MIGITFVFGLLAISCLLSITRPTLGIIAFYGFVLLDPAWNWRWSLPPGIQYQKYLFLAIVAGLVLNGFRGQPLSKVSRWCCFSLIAFLVVSYISAAESILPAASARFMSYLWKIVVVAVLSVYTIREPRHLVTLLAIVALAQGYNSYQINLEYFSTGFSRYAHSNWGSVNADNNGYSIITVPVLAASLSLAFCLTSRYRFIFLAIALLQIHQIMLMQSRGSMLGALAMAVLFVWYMPRNRTNTILLTGIFLAGVLLAGPSVVDEFSSAFASGENLDSSAESRFYLWQAGMRITMDYPLLGVGPNAARVLVPQSQYYDGGLNIEYKALHNLFFDVSTGVGLIGFVFYFVFLFLPAIYCFRTYRRDEPILCAPRLAVFCGMFGYVIASMFSSGLLFEVGYLLPAIGCCCSNFDSQPVASTPTAVS